MSEQSPYGAPNPGWSGPPPPAAPKKRRKWPWILLVAVLLLVGGCVGAIALVANEVSDESDRTVRVRYEVTGTAENVSIAYSTWRDGDMSTSQVTSERLPWTKEVSTTGFVKGGTLAVTLGEAGGKVACSVTVDGGEPRRATASGAFATATCSGF
ncbi:membrane protein [Streptomyces sp. ScaeMP-e48]|uniref:MmpS family transport accessory protein n=1 Tax=Streptomyces TaxID=1883 RepID=UPI000823B3FC|nr:MULTISPECIES: MmpS family transport accessory protein [Streptomyces]MCX4651912.1 MmpS family transport accessory protein [Streptomyces microflavus]SCK39041.1 membrane protein [Streptomyces sp. ScaeMP-e48]